MPSKAQGLLALLLHLAHRQERPGSRQQAWVQAIMAAAAGLALSLPGLSEGECLVPLLSSCAAPPPATLPLADLPRPEGALAARAWLHVRPGTGLLDSCRQAASRFSPVKCRRLPVAVQTGMTKPVRLRVLHELTWPHGLSPDVRTIGPW